MTGISQKPGTKKRMFAASAAAAAAVGLAACSAAGGAPAATATKTVTASAPASQAPAADDSTAAAHGGQAKGAGGRSAAGGSASGKLPEYRPSSLVSKSAYSTVLTSPDSVSKIGAFYRKALAAGGWHLRSDSAGPYHASFTAYRGHQGASVSVYSRGSGSGISVSTHPR